VRGNIGRKSSPKEATSITQNLQDTILFPKTVMAQLICPFSSGKKEEMMNLFVN